MVDGILRLSELRASDEMTPRVDMIGIDLDTPVEKQIDIARNAGHRYLPVYVRTPDAIEGFMDAVQFLLDPEHNAHTAKRDMLYVPENVLLDDLLVRFQSSGKHIACVLDEYGGTAGLITRGDILELITVSVPENDADAGEPIRRLHDDVWLIDGTVSLEEVNHELDLELEADDADRIAGWVTFHAGGRLLSGGESVVAQGCRVTVRRMHKRRILAVQLEVIARPEPDTEQLPDSDDLLLDGFDEEEDNDF